MFQKKPIILITTPIYYCNSDLHLGHLYSSFYADFLSKFYKNEGYKVFFLTGVDQHGQKIYKKAKENKMDTKNFVDIQTNKILKLWKKANLNFTHFIQTTDENHKKFVKKIFNKLLDKKQIILKNYEGKYCVYCENFSSKINKTDKCLICKLDLIELSEKNYFLLFKKEDVNKIIKFISFYKNNNNNNKYLNQLDYFLEKNQIDFSISRNKIDWGIVLNKKENQKAYVWFDALLGYISPFSNEEKKEIWENKDSKIIQILGKEIIKFHLIYWLILLEKLKFKKPSNFLVHGWILNKNNKMSKSLNNTISAFDFLERFDSDIARLFLAKLMNPKTDISFNMEMFDEFYNSYIVKNLSNFHFRLLNMIKKYNFDFNNIENIKFFFDLKLKIEIKNIKNYIKNFKNNFINFDIYNSFKNLFELLDYGNKKITKEEPWMLFKEKKTDYLNFILYILIIILKIVSDFLLSFTPSISKKIKNNLLNIENIDNIYETNLKIFKNFELNSIEHLYDKK